MWNLHNFIFNSATRLLTADEFVSSVTFFSRLTRFPRSSRLISLVTWFYKVFPILKDTMPTATENQIDAVAKILNDPSRPLKERFRALFTLRNLGGPKAIEGISQCFSDSSALLKHELAYCLGQMQDLSAIPILTKVLKDTQQEPMVRHEAGTQLP